MSRGGVRRDARVSLWGVRRALAAPGHVIGMLLAKQRIFHIRRVPPRQRGVRHHDRNRHDRKGSQGKEGIKAKPKGLDDIYPLISMAS
jgi:hypothetical protein